MFEGGACGQLRLQLEEGAGDGFLKAGSGWMLSAIVGGSTWCKKLWSDSGL